MRFPDERDSLALVLLVKAVEIIIAGYLLRVGWELY